MNENYITAEKIATFERCLHSEERADGTIEKYLRDVRTLAAWLEGAPVTKERVITWKEHLCASGYAPRTVNSMLTAANRFLSFCRWEDCRVKPLRLQRKIFRSGDRELSRGEYERLIEAAEGTGRRRLALLMETICATGIRVSEVGYITVEAARAGRTDVSLKGKIRTILLPGKLCRKLLRYAGEVGISSGEIFLTRRGTPLSRRQIWGEMKALCRKAGVDGNKVFPHNLRHLFAVTFYRICRDVVKLADILGHSSVDTTRIYLMTTGQSHRRTLEQMRLIS